MATGNLTLIDIVARSSSDALIGLVEDVTTSQPEFQVIPARTRPGTTYKVLRRTAYPTAAFRDVNDSGVSIGKSTFVQEVKNMYFLDCQMQIDEAVVKADTGEVGDVLAQEAAGALEGCFATIGSQIWYGTGADAKGFAGLQSQLVGSLAAGGTSTSTSVYLVWLDPRGVHLEVGNEGSISMPSWRTMTVTSGTSAKTVYTTNISAYLGLTVASASAVWRISGVDTGTNEGWTDALSAQLLSHVPSNRRNGLRWFANATAIYTLQKSRSALGYAPVNGGGSTPAFASTPTESLGIPITATDSLVDTETNTGTVGAWA